MSTLNYDAWSGRLQDTAAARALGDPAIKKRDTFPNHLGFPVTVGYVETPVNLTICPTRRVDNRSVVQVKNMQTKSTYLDSKFCKSVFLVPLN